MDKVSADMKELKNVMDEMKKTKLHLKKLKIQMEELKDKVSDYMEQQKLPGVRMGTIAVYTKTKPKVRRRKQDEKKSALREVLVKKGIANPELFTNEILESLKGDTEIVPTVQIKQFKDFMVF